MQLARLASIVKTAARDAVVQRLGRISANETVRKVSDVYEEFLGIKDVKKTQQNVLVAESEFTDASRQRRTVQSQLISLQDNLKQIRKKLDSTPRGDEAYLELITNEHKLIKNEIKFVNNLRNQEEIERELFSKFSHTLRDAHEIERLRQEKTKYLSVIGSIVGAILGIICTSINHAMKMNDLKKILQAIEAQNSAMLLEQISAPVAVTVPQDDAIVNATPVPSGHDVPQEVSAVPSTSTDNTPIAQLLSDTETNLEYKMKINALATVVATYALLAITIPVLLRLLGD